MPGASNQPRRCEKSDVDRCGEKKCLLASLMIYCALGNFWWRCVPDGNRDEPTQIGALFCPAGMFFRNFCFCPASKNPVADQNTHLLITFSRVQKRTKSFSNKQPPGPPSSPLIYIVTKPESIQTTIGISHFRASRCWCDTASKSSATVQTRNDHVKKPGLAGWTKKCSPVKLGIR